jgi:hypothetical protein
MIMKKIHLFTGFIAISNIMAAQNVGIGTVIPASKLHVKGAADATQLIIEANSTQSNTNPLIKLRNSSGIDLMWIHSDDFSNSFVGLSAGRVNNAGGGGVANTFTGSSAGFSNSTGYSNSAMGNGALYSNTTGYNNTAMGHGTLLSNTTGYSNSAIGFRSLYWNTSGNYNSAMGYGALFSNTTGIANASMGYNSLYSNTTGGFNSAMGGYALYSNTTGYYNCAMGHDALTFNTTGTGNIAMGYSALFNNTTGDANSAEGFESLYFNTSGHSNSTLGNQSLYYNTTGHHNVGIGISALYTNIDGNYNTALGANANVSASYWGDATAIGANAVVTSDDRVMIGGPYPGILVIGGYANWSNISDGRFKENIQEDVPGLSFISKLRPVTYQIDNQKLVNHITHLMPDSVASRYKKTNAEYAALYQKRFTGFVAQEVERDARELGYDFDGVNTPRNETDHYSISYASFVMPLVKAVQEQQAIIETLQKQVDLL